MNDERCLRLTYEEVQKSSTSLDVPNPLQIVYYCNALKGSNREAEFTKLFHRMDKSDYQTERLRIINGLLCSNDEKILRNFLQTALGPTLLGATFYRSHERRRIFGSIAARSEVGLKVLTGMIEEYFDDFNSIMGNGYVDSLLKSASKRIVSESDVNLILSTLDKLETMNKTLQSTTRSTIIKNIDFNQNWSKSIKPTDIFDTISNLMENVNEFEGAWRLPKLSVPNHYKIHLDLSNVHTGALPYNGEVEIDLTIIDATDKILLHSRDQFIDEIKVVDKDSGAEIKIFDYRVHPETFNLAIYFEQTLNVNMNLLLTIKYSTQLLTEIDGLYRDSYIVFDDQSANYQTRYLATTQFQAVEARRVFPCYDGKT
jgi:hypothetical protein